MIDVRRGSDRARSAAAGLESCHSFSFGPHYDPANLGFGALMAHNEDHLQPGAGYARHAHRGVDILTWVLDGSLVHQHWLGDGGPSAREVLTAGAAQVLRTGSGVHHAEHAEPNGSGAHYVQMWIASGRPEEKPSYARSDLQPPRSALSTPSVQGDVVARTIASGDDPAALTLSHPGAELAVAHMPAGARLTIRGSGYAHAFIARGAVALDDGTRLDAGDSLRSRDEPELCLGGIRAAEILLWRQSC